MDYNIENIEQIIEMTGSKSKISLNQYKKEIEELFKKWKSSVDTNDTAFITDGVMDPEIWFKQNERILFVLKEAYSEEGANDWDLAKDHVLLKNPFGRRATWRNISLWTKGLKNPYADYEPNDDELKVFGNRYLHSIAAINIKKYNGKNTSDDEDINYYAVNEKDYIKREIELCDPSVIVCCNTAFALNNVIDYNYEKRNSQLFYYTYINGHEVIVIDFYHPANQYPKIMNYLTLCSIYQRAKHAQVKRIKEL